MLVKVQVVRDDGSVLLELVQPLEQIALGGGMRWEAAPGCRAIDERGIFYGLRLEVGWESHAARAERLKAEAEARANEPEVFYEPWDDDD